MRDHQILLAPILGGNIILEDKEIVVCAICSKVTKGGITKAKEHLMAKPWIVAACAKCPKKVRVELWGYLKDKKKQENEKFQGMRQHFLEDYSDNEEERAVDEGFANIE